MAERFAQMKPQTCFQRNCLIQKQIRCIIGAAEQCIVGSAAVQALKGCSPKGKIRHLWGKSADLCFLAFFLFSFFMCLLIVLSLFSTK